MRRPAQRGECDPVGAPGNHDVPYQLDLDLPVEVGADDLGRPQLGQHRRARVAVLVVAADGEDGHPGSDGGEEVLGVGRSAVVRHLEDVGSHTTGAQEGALAGLLDVAGQQQGGVPGDDAQDHGAVVGIPAVDAGRRGAEDGGGSASQAKCVACGDLAHGHPARRRRRPERRGDQRLVAAAGRRPGQDGADRQAFEDRGQAGHVVAVRMGEHHTVEVGDAPTPQRRDRRRLVRSAVDEQTRHPSRSVGRLDEQRVALSDVECHEAQVRSSEGRRRSPKDRREDEQRHEHGCGGRARPRADASQRQGCEQQHRHHRQVLGSKTRSPGGQARERQDRLRRRPTENGEHTRRRHGDLREDAGGHGDERGDPGQRNRQQVGERRPETHPVVGHEQDRRDRRLRADAEGQRLP